MFWPNTMALIATLLGHQIEYFYNLCTNIQRVKRLYLLYFKEC